MYLFPPFEQLKEVSPYLVLATDTVKTWFLEQNQGLAGFFFASLDSIEEIAEQLRRLIQVESPYGSTVFLKMANSECAYVLLSTQCQPLWKVINRAWLPTRQGWQYVQRPELTATQDTPVRFKLTDEQWQRLGNITWLNTLETVERHVQQWFPDLAQQWQSDPELFHRHAQWAYQQGFSSERDLMLFFNVLGFLGVDALEKGKYPEIDPLLHQASSRTPSQRIEAAAELAYQHSQSSQEVQG
ncbi:membrane protein [Vibrio cholerae]|nr:membrane protein [Vibrio cholerae]